jgi:hypothetical protein
MHITFNLLTIYVVRNVDTYLLVVSAHPEEGLKRLGFVVTF